MGNLSTVVACHCGHCRRSSGTAYSLNLLIDDAQLAWTGDEPAAYDDRSDAGRIVTRMFCDCCGSPLASRADMLRGKLVLKVGSLDVPIVDAPKAQVWTDSALPWAVFEGIPSFPKGR